MQRIKSKFGNRKFVVGVLAASVVFCNSITTMTLAYVSSSTNYVLQNDSINFGGNMSSSSLYKMEDTLGEIATGNSTSSEIGLYAGYQAMQPDTYISITVPVDISLSPTIDGMKGGISSGQAEWNVETNNAAGYALLVKSATSPALASDRSSFDDYQPGYSSPDFNWTVTNNSALFGFTPSGSDITSTFRDNGVGCGSGSIDSSLACWDGFSTLDKTVAESDFPNERSGGATTTIDFRAELGKDKVINAGSYQANIIMTAITL